MNLRCLLAEIGITDHNWRHVFLDPNRTCKDCGVAERLVSSPMLGDEWERISAVDAQGRAVPDLPLDSVAGHVLDGERVDGSKR